MNRVQAAPAPGVWVMDTESGCVGKAVAWDIQAQRLTLEPPLGGDLWEASHWRYATEAERVCARLSVLLLGVRKAVKRAGWMLRPEPGKGAPSAIYAAACMVCNAGSPVCDNERRPVDDWLINHVNSNPEHQQFKLTTETFWRTTPVPGSHE